MIGCLFGLIAFFTPRIAIVLIAVAGRWLVVPFEKLQSPFNGLLLPILGFIFAPYTLLAYCLAIHQNGRVDGMWLVLVVIAVLLDLGVIGHGGSARRRMRNKQE